MLLLTNVCLYVCVLYKYDRLNFNGEKYILDNFPSGATKPLKNVHNIITLQNNDYNKDIFIVLSFQNILLYILVCISRKNPITLENK